MIKNFHFTKMHGAGNDFILLDCRERVPDDIGALAVKLCDRHFGIGADGILLLCDSEVADVAMRIINADGSEAQMCGNGIRCIGKYVYENHICHRPKISVDTLAGLKYLTLHVSDTDDVVSVSVDMGHAVIENLNMKLSVDSGTFDIAAISTGNPHCVVFTDNLSSIDIPISGSRIECHQMWPERTNVEFISIESRHDIIQRTWERGAGQTLACGTGAIAAAVAAVGRGYCDWPVSVHLDGGTLIIDHNPLNDHVLLTGSAAEVFEGRL